MSVRPASDCMLRARVPVSFMRGWVNLFPVGIDWRGLYDAVSVSGMPYRDEVLAILSNSPEWIVRGVFIFEVNRIPKIIKFLVKCF